MTFFGPCDFLIALWPRHVQINLLINFYIILTSSYSKDIFTAIFVL